MIHRKKTKIIATLGPAVSEKETLKQLIIAGANVFRINFSHGSYDDIKKLISNILELNEELKVHTAILADLQGPKIRIGEVENNNIFLKEGEFIKITTNYNQVIGNTSAISINYEHFPKDVKKGDNILIDDGKILLCVESTNCIDEVTAKVVYGGVLSSRKGVNLPNTKISLPCLTDKDMQDLEFAVENDLNWIGLSFVRSSEDIIEIKHIIAKYGKRESPRVIAKIEKPEALDDIDDIIKHADGIMVARGDLGVEIPLQNVPLIQKMIVKKCLHSSKPVIIATQMMESMINNSSPTRAEVNDVANSVLDGADAVMLSAETSVGKYPVKVVENMTKIIEQAETFESIYYKHSVPTSTKPDRIITDSICYNACNMAQQVKANAIIALTRTGYTAIKISSQRPKAPIFIFTDNRKLLDTISLVWGINGYFYNKFISTDHTIEDINNRLLREGYVNENDLVINTSTTPLMESGKTNMIKLCLI